MATNAGGGIGIEHREKRGKPFVGIFGKNGGRFGENPLTEKEYEEMSALFLAAIRRGDQYTSIHGDHRTYSPGLGAQATCYGRHYDRRIIERMVAEKRIPERLVDIERVAATDL